MKIVYEIYSKRGNFCGLNYTDSLQKIAEVAEFLKANGQALTITKVSEEQSVLSNERQLTALNH